jgi:hypothetical protein
MYNPKPAKYEEGNAFFLTHYIDHWDIISNLRSILSDVSKCLLYHLTDTPYENKYLGCDTGCTIQRNGSWKNRTIGNINDMECVWLTW